MAALTRWLELLWDRPARIVSASFVTVALVGTALLMIPAATTAPGALRFLDALFTATSAVCVTGLIVVDTATAFTTFGQGVILLLIQIGGLGIMAFTVSTVYLVRRRLTMDEAELLSFMLNERNRHVVARQLRDVILLTFAIEAVGAVVLTAAFVARGTAVGTAVWYGVFHAVSAFCNAGFALFSDSLEQFVSAPVINVSVMLLIVAGGIGFGPLILFRRDPVPQVADAADEPLTYQPRIVSGGRMAGVGRRLGMPQALAARVAVTGTVVLIILGAVLYYLLEARHALLGMSLPRKYLAALFQSVTLRTAGFDTVAFSDVRRATLLVTLPFMFIGGASGGTAGGIKIGSAAVLVAEVRRFLLRQRDAVVFHRRLAGRLITQAVVLSMAGVAAVFVATTMLSITETAPLETIVFEVVSALGTVGLSTGLTGTLSDTGRVVVVLLMFVGRLGPLTLFAALRPEGKTANVRVPEGELPVG